MKNNRWLIALIIVFTTGGFLLQLWPVSAVGVVAMGFIGRGFFALPLGLLLDLAYGAPVGPLYHLFFPFTILGLAVVVLRYWGSRYFLDRSSPGSL